MKRTILILSALFIFFISCKETKPTTIAVVETPVLPDPIMKYGLDLNDYEIIEDTVRSGDTFGNILNSYSFSNQAVFHAAASLSKVFDVRNIQAGKPYKILRKNQDTIPDMFIYEPTKVDYVVVPLQDDSSSFTDKHPISIKRRTASGVINSTLSEAMEEDGLGMAAIYELSDIYRWSIDFFKLQKGDRYKMIFNERYINDSIYAGIENIEVAIFETDNEPKYAFSYMADSVAQTKEYYDEKGHSLRSFFLKAPVKYSRISSRFTKRRFHPVQKRWKAHKGTDYAAPYHTPIVSTANGVVIASGYTRGNGNYVKVKHNETYTTQYLHMTKRKAKVGQRVKQGDVIGTVGSTGLATGPHVCYRFWVRGVQRDPFQFKPETTEPLKEAQMAPYLEFIAPLRDEIDRLPYAQENQELAL